MDELLRVPHGYEGAKTKHVSAAFAPLARVANSKRKLSRKVRREAEDAQRTRMDGRGEGEKDVRIIRTKKDRTGSFEPPLQRACDAECRRRRFKLAKKKNTPSQTGQQQRTMPCRKKKKTLTL
jgi:hypothetical protein